MGIIRNLLQRWTLRKTKLTSDPDWVIVFSSSDAYSVHILKMKLDNHNIPAAVFNQQDSSYNAFGYIYLNVPKDFKQKAIDIINNSHE